MINSNFWGKYGSIRGRRRSNPILSKSCVLRPRPDPIISKLQYDILRFMYERCDYSLRLRFQCKISSKLVFEAAGTSLMEALSTCAAHLPLQDATIFILCLPSLT